VTASGYGIFIFENPFGAERGIEFYFSLFLEQFGLIGLVVGLLGLAVLRRRRARGLTVIAFTTYLAFNLIYRVADIEVFFIPLFLIWSVWVGIAAGWLLTGHTWVGAGRPSRLRLPVTSLAILLRIDPVIGPYTTTDVT
jgi:hypothetical protein